MNRQVLRLAIPNIIANITVPLISMIDLVIVGHLGNKSYIGAIAIGSMIFNFVYWLFSFLRMGTSGLTAQAYGAKNPEECTLQLQRACFLAFSGSFFLLILQIPIAKTAFYLIGASPDIEKFALQYFLIRIWAAPATLGNYAFQGWFIGMQNAIVPMVLAIVINFCNAVFSFFFAVFLKMGITGVALGTVIAQYTGLALSFIIFHTKYKSLLLFLNLRKALLKEKLRTCFNTNSHIFLRTLCLIIVFTFFTSASASYNDNILAINTLLMQFFMLFSFIMDGFAYAGEALTGKFIGARSSGNLKLAIRILFRWGWGLAILFTFIYALFGEHLLSLLTDIDEIVILAKDYYFWVMLIPLAGFAAFLWDGIYVGATASKIMQNITFFAMVGFFILYFSLYHFIQNNALWVGLIGFLALRGILQWLYAKKAIYLH